MANRYMKRCLLSLTIREIQIKIPGKYYYTLIKMVKIQETGNIVLEGMYLSLSSIADKSVNGTITLEKLSNL